MNTKILVKIYGEKHWVLLTFGTRAIKEFEDAIDIARLSRYRCKLKMVDEENKTTRKWNNL